VLVTVTYGGRMRVWDAATGAAGPEVALGEGSPVVEVSPDGRFVATGGDRGVVRIWDRSLVLLRELPGHTSWVRDLVFRSDGALVSAGADGTAFLWTGLPDAEGTTLTERSSAMESAAISPDGGTVAIGNEDGEVVLWSTTDRAARRADRAVLAGHDGKVTGVAYDAAGRWIVTADEAGTVRLWDAGTRLEPVGQLGRTGLVWDMAGVPGAEEVYTVADGGPTRWVLDPDTWGTRACAVAGRNLSAAEERRYQLPDGPPTCPGLPGG